MKYLFLAIQILIAGFYTYFTLLMWSPFIQGHVLAKIGIAFIVLAPVLSLILMYRGGATIRANSTLLIALLMALQLSVVFSLARA